MTSCRLPQASRLVPCFGGVAKGEAGWEAGLLPIGGFRLWLLQMYIAIMYVIFLAIISP